MGNKNGYDLVCKHCGKTFHHVNKNKVYCSDECKKGDRKHLIWSYDCVGIRFL